MPDTITILSDFEGALLFPRDYWRTGEIAEVLVIIGLTSFSFYLGGFLGIFFLLFFVLLALFEVFVAWISGSYGDFVFLAVVTSEATEKSGFWVAVVLGALFISCFLCRKKLLKTQFKAAFFSALVVITLILLQITQFQRNTLPLIAKQQKDHWIGPTIVLYWPYWAYRYVSDKTFEQWDRADEISGIQDSGLLSQSAIYMRRVFPGIVGDGLGAILLRFDSGAVILKEKDKKFPAGLQNISPRIPDASIIVLVIGESSTPDRWGLFGYKWNTTPRLSERQKAGQICKIDKAHAVAHQTRFAVLPNLSMWSPSHKSEMRKSKNFLELAKKNNFLTYYITMQKEYGLYSGDIEVAVKSAQYYAGPKMPGSPPLLSMKPLGHEKETDIEGLLPQLKKALNDGNTGQKFIILHAYGSHLPYSWDFDAKDKKDFPLADNYDLSISHTDRLLDGVLEQVAQTHLPSAVFYASDHGEVINIGHGILGVQRRDFPIPLFVAGLNGLSTARLCEKLESYRGEDGWYNSVMNRYFIADLLGYTPDPSFVAQDKKSDRILSLENDYSNPLPWKVLPEDLK